MVRIFIGKTWLPALQMCSAAREETKGATGTAREGGQRTSLEAFALSNHLKLLSL